MFLNKKKIHPQRLKQSPNWHVSHNNHVAEPKWLLYVFIQDFIETRNCKPWPYYLLNMQFRKNLSFALTNTTNLHRVRPLGPGQSLACRQIGHCPICLVHLGLKALCQSYSALNKAHIFNILGPLQHLQIYSTDLFNRTSANQQQKAEPKANESSMLFRKQNAQKSSPSLFLGSSQDL